MFKAWAPGTSVGPIESPGTQFELTPSAAATYRAHPSMIQLLLVPRLRYPTGQFLAVPVCSPGRDLQGMCPGEFGGTPRITDDPV